MTEAREAASRPEPVAGPAAAAPRRWSLAEARSRTPETLVLDARDGAAFARGHVAGAGQLAPDAFEPRRAELPPRDVVVLVVHDEPAAACAAAERLAGMGYAGAGWLDEPLSALPGGLSDTAPAARLWRPSPFLERVIGRLPSGRALDLAAGSGRESVFLALHGWRVDAWDRAPEALERAAALAARHGVSLATRVVDLERPPEPPAPAGGWDVVMAFRFLHRPLFPWIARAVRPGGAVVYETYRVGQERFGRPRSRRFLLEPGELARALAGFEVELFEEPDPPGGPVLSRLLARRPA